MQGSSSLQVSSEQRGSLLIPIILSKLQNEIRLEIARKSTSKVWKIKELIETIKGKIETREANEVVVKAHEVHQRKQNPVAKYSKPIPPIAKTLLSMESKGFGIRCVNCNGEHYSASCTKFRRSKDRRGILKRKSRCFNCLKTGHNVKNCFNTK